MARRPWLWLGIGCYVLEFVLWLAFISLVPLSDGVLLGSISIVVVMLLGRVFFRERLTPLRVLGILLVSLGVGIVGLKGKAMRRFYLIGFLALMAFDTLAQISFKVAGEHALPLEFSPAWLLRVFGQPWIYGAFIGYLGHSSRGWCCSSTRPSGGLRRLVSGDRRGAGDFGGMVRRAHRLAADPRHGAHPGRHLLPGGQRVLDGAEDRACGAAGATRR